MALISAASFAAAKPTLSNGSYSGGTPLPGSFAATHPASSPAPAPARSSGGSPAPQPSYQGGGSTASSGPSAAQLAAQQQAAALAQAENNYHNIYNGDMDSINTGISAGASGLHANILDAFNGSGGFASQQSGINNEGVQNELAKLQGMQGVRDMVNNGIQGGGVVLDNAGAGTSSAGEALARAYGVQGRQQASKVGGQYAQGQNQIQTEQGNLSRAEDNFMNVDIPDKKNQTISSIVSSANQALTYLSAMFASANLPDQINLAQQIADVKARATSALSAFDGELQSNRNANAPIAPDAALSKASQLFQAGTAPAKEFNFTSQLPAQLQGTGPEASPLPIAISSPQNKNDNGIVQ